MNGISIPKLSLWPFWLADLLLLGLAGWIVARSSGPLKIEEAALLFFCVALGAWFSVLPYRLRYRAVIRLTESDRLTEAVAQIQKLEQIQLALGSLSLQWQAMQDQSARTAESSKELTDRMAATTQEFHAFFDKADQSEKNHLRLETEKLRRAEAEWLQVVIRILDHVFALHQAGMRSGHPQLVGQLSQFQAACRDVARRVGLIPFAPEPGELFDGKVHQVFEADPPAEPEPISVALATGYTYQGALLRKAVVRLGPPLPESEPIEETPAS